MNPPKKKARATPDPVPDDAEVYNNSPKRCVHFELNVAV